MADAADGDDLAGTDAGFGYALADDRNRIAPEAPWCRSP